MNLHIDVLDNFNPFLHMKKHKADELIGQYLQGKASQEERRLLEHWFLKDLKTNDNMPNLDRVEEADKRISAYLKNHIGADEDKKKPTPLE